MASSDEHDARMMKKRANDFVEYAHRLIREIMTNYGKDRRALV